MEGEAMKILHRVKQAGSLMLSLGLAGAVSASSTTATLDSFISGSATELNGKQAMSVYLGGDNSNYCEVVVTPDYISSSKGIMLNLRRNQPDLSVDCTWEDQYYVLSSEHPTRVNLTITKSQGSLPMRMSLNGRLITPKGDQLQIATTSAIPLRNQ